MAVYRHNDPNLQDFLKLGPRIYLCQPDTQSEGTPDRFSLTSGSTVDNRFNATPDLIILCTWMGAGSRPISKYAKGLMDLYPEARIMLIRSAPQDIMLKTQSSQVSDMHAAADYVEELVEIWKRQGVELKTLVHVFSNGGSWSACILSEAYMRLTQNPLPVSALVIDSAPSFPHMKRSFRAMMSSLPKSFILRFLGTIAFCIIICMSYMLNKLRLQTNVIIKLRQMLNDLKGPFLKANIPRTYICSQKDAMVPMDDVVDHANEAQANLLSGGGPVREGTIDIEEFHDSDHVGHLIKDANRYWKIIQDTWNKTY